MAGEKQSPQHRGAWRPHLDQADKRSGCPGDSASLPEPWDPAAHPCRPGPVFRPSSHPKGLQGPCLHSKPGSPGLWARPRWDMSVPSPKSSAPNPYKCAHSPHPHKANPPCLGGRSSDLLGVQLAHPAGTGLSLTAVHQPHWPSPRSVLLSGPSPARLLGDVTTPSGLALLPPCLNPVPSHFHPHLCPPEWTLSPTRSWHGAHNTSQSLGTKEREDPV